jgi:hypothetical protein
VPFNQAVETRAEFVAAGTPYHGYTVVGNQRTGCSSTNETTLTAEIGNEIPGVGTTLEPTLCLAGHATETNPNTPVMHAAFTVLHWMTVGGHIGVGEAVWALP